jgi:hypothetical protein
MFCVLALSSFVEDIFFSDVGIILFKTLIFTNLVSALVLVHGPAVYESEVDRKAGDPEGLWFSNGIV